MIGWFQRRWHKAQALSDLQLRYGLPLKEPLDKTDPLAKTELQMIMKMVMEQGGTPFDTSISFMIYRLNSEVRSGSTNIGVAGTMLAALNRQHYKLYEAHMNGLKIISEIAKANREKAASA